MCFIAKGDALSHTLNLYVPFANTFCPILFAILPTEASTYQFIMEDILGLTHSKHRHIGISLLKYSHIEKVFDIMREFFFCTSGILVINRRKQHCFSAISSYTKVVFDGSTLLSL